MILFPFAKINLGLNVVRKRPDGYHDIESVLVPIPLRDALEAVVDQTLADGETVFTRSGLDIPGDPSADLCMKAHKAVAKLHPLPGLRIHLHKRIPLGAGLGGGSSDGTHTILLLDRLLGLDLEREAMLRIASELGSDCPFFLDQRVQLAEGRGEILSPIPLELKGYWLAMVNPGIHVPTGEVFSNTSPTGTSRPIVDVLLNEPMEQWRDLAPNVLEDHVFSSRPVVAGILERINRAGAAHAAMSGSGSTVFGLFRDRPPALEWPPDHSHWTLRL